MTMVTISSNSNHHHPNTSNSNSMTSTARSNTTTSNSSSHQRSLLSSSSSLLLSLFYCCCSHHHHNHHHNHQRGQRSNGIQQLFVSTSQQQQQQQQETTRSRRRRKRILLVHLLVRTTIVLGLLLIITYIGYMNNLQYYYYYYYPNHDVLLLLQQQQENSLSIPKTNKGTIKKRWGQNRNYYNTDQKLMQQNEQNNYNLYYNTIITIQDLPDIVQLMNSSSINSSSSSSSSSSTGTGTGTGTAHTTFTTTKDIQQQQQQENEMIFHKNDRQPIIDRIVRSGIRIDDSIVPYLPTWESVLQLYGSQPIIYTKIHHDDENNENINNNDINNDICIQYRIMYPNITQRYIGIAGQMNTGTNALVKYLQQNIYFNNNKEEQQYDDNNDQHHILWTVPWYKHSWISLYNQYQYPITTSGNKKNNNKDITSLSSSSSSSTTKPPPQPPPPPYETNHQQVMAIVIIRDPYFWMQSMCESPYSLEWQRNKTHCPNLVEDHPFYFPSTPQLHTNGTQVRIRWGGSSSSSSSNTGNSGTSSSRNDQQQQQQPYIRTWSSIVHMYNEWYMEYVLNVQNISRIIIRFEDILFHTESVIDTIRQCVGAQWIHTKKKNHTTNNDTDMDDVYDPIFQYPVVPVKTHPYFTKYKPSSSYLSAIIKYGQNIGQPQGQRYGTMSVQDRLYAQEHLHPKLLELFHYNIQ